MPETTPAQNQLTVVHTKLKSLRTRKDLKLRPTAYLKQTYTDFDGSEKPLVIRYYQVQGILHLMLMRRFLLGDDTGLGKSLEVIASLCYLWETDPNRKVIVLTTKSATEQWAKEFSKFTRGVRAIACRGTATQRALARAQFEQSTGPTVIIMGYRSAVQDFTALQGWKDLVVVFDEATAFKNPKTQVHQACKFLGGHADRVWGLTATLIKNHLMEGFGIYSVIMPGLFKMSFNRFMLYYCLTRMQRIPKSNRQIPIIIGYMPEKIEEFKEVIDPYYIGRPKHEVASELPSLTTRIIDVPMSPEQEAKYAEALEGILEMGAGRDSQVTAVTELTAIVYCQQIVNHLELIGHQAPSPKLNALMDLLTEGEFEDEKVIVFSRFRTMVDIIMRTLEAQHIKAVRITGDEKGTERQAAMTAFQDPRNPVRVCCITEAGSEAINLQAAKAVICYDTPWSAGNFLQLIGRMIRIGSVHDRCYALHLVARGKRKTVDQRVIEVLSKKMVLVEAVLGKRIKGEGESKVIGVENDISDLFRALRQDAQGLIDVR